VPDYSLSIKISLFDLFCALSGLTGEIRETPCWVFIGREEDRLKGERDAGEEVTRSKYAGVEIFREIRKTGFYRKQL
jgi:hypothetical protein